MLSVLGAKRGLDVEMALRDVQARERAGSVLLPLGNRHAVIPHAMTNACKQLLMAVGTTREGVPWGPTPDDQEPVHLVFLVLAEANNPGPHVAALAEIARLLQVPGFYRRILAAPTPKAALEILSQEE